MSEAMEDFAALVSREEFSLAEASLLLAQDAYPDISVRSYVAQLDAMAAEVRARIAADAFAEQKVHALNHYLFRECGYRGNVEDYYDPRNSYLNEVMERRTGIPITLSIVYLEVGRRLGLSVAGVSFPGHFLVKLKLKRGQVVLDPFLAGESQSEADLLQRLATMLPAASSDSALLDRYLKAATPRQIVARVLRNLKNIYAQEGRLEMALSVVNRMLQVAPDSAEHLRDRGLLYMRLECFRPALSDLRSYLHRRPEAPDTAEICGRIAELQQACARLN